jgi:hypothetical protein
MKDFSRTDKGRELAELGYALYGDVTDLFGVRKIPHQAIGVCWFALLF